MLFEPILGSLTGLSDGGVGWGQTSVGPGPNGRLDSAKFFNSGFLNALPHRGYLRTGKSKNLQLTHQPQGVP